ncbi:hypothetical protein DFH27DRAFT_172198 [Peziza echinospora]|nr:hypothetical protein DFH27DRAFT_172198 [Peziza echinospora]
MLSSWIQPAVLGGLLMISQALASPVPQTAVSTSLITCGTSFASMPKMDDCIAIINTIPNTPQPTICTTVYITDVVIGTNGTCRVRAFDAGGKAHCQSGAQQKAAAMEVVNTCALKGVKYIAAGGKAQFYAKSPSTSLSGAGIILELAV